MHFGKDIFISYKNDGEGNNFAARLCADLEKMGYEVYFNPNEQHAGSFPDRLREAVESCKDFLLIITNPCLEQLMRHDKIDWVREELLTAYRNKKKIIPLLMPGVSMPKDKEEMPEELQFLPDADAISICEPYNRSPLDLLTEWITAPRLSGEYTFENTYNSNADKNIDEDFNEVLEKSKDDPKAMYELANMYYYGIAGDDKGCSRDFFKAAQILEKLAVTDSEYAVQANSILAEMNYHGIMPRKPQSYKEALKYHEKARASNGFSARESAYLRSRGCGCDFDYNSIVQNYQEAIERGDTVAIVGLAKFYLNYGKYKEAEKLYQKAKNVLPDAEFQLGMLYRNGLHEDPPKPDFYRAAYHFQHAIDSGNNDPEVYHQLGRLFFTPIDDFPKDFVAAEKNFTIAADKGNRKAQYKLGLMYEYGYVKLDLKKAIHYHTKAAEQGDAKSAYHLAMLYQHPKFKNYQEAFKYAELSAKKGVMEGEFLLGIFLYYGRGCKADEDKAYKYFCKAYEHGMYAAKLYLDKICS